MKKKVAITLLFSLSLLAAKPLPWLGIAFRIHRDAAGARFLHVERVAAGSPAERGKLLPGDVIQTINGQRVDFSDDLELLLFLGERTPGERVRLGVVRAGKGMAVILTVAAMPEAKRAAWERSLAVARQLRADARR